MYRQGVDPESVIAIIMQEFQRMSLQRPSELDDLDFIVQPFSETLGKVLVELPAREAGISGPAIDEKAKGATSTAMYVAFEFALRCVSAVLLDPLADHYESFTKAARLSSSLLWIELDGPARDGERPAAGDNGRSSAERDGKSDAGEQRH